MYKHHEESLKIMVEHYEKMPGVIALVFGGSVAKGTERPDSDLDGMVILTDDAYEERRKKGQTTECLFMCTYEGGYFDIKYMTKGYIKAAAEKGSEPTRNSFMGSRVLFTSDEEIPEIVERIPVFQQRETEDKMLSFYADLCLNYHYFWQDCKPDGYMKLHTAVEIIYSIYRMMLQENKVLFQCNRRLEADVEKLGGVYAEIAALGKRFSESLENEDCDALVQKFEEITAFVPPEDRGVVGSRYLADFEQWWLNPRPLIAEW